MQQLITAPFFRRLAARLIDLGFALVLTFALAVVVGLISGLVTAFSGGLDEDGLAIALLVWLCYFLAYVALEWFLVVNRGGQTLGKGLMGIRVVRASGTGVAPASSFVRLFVFFIPFFFASQAGGSTSAGWEALATIGFLWSTATLIMVCIRPGGRRGVHDYLSGTRVVLAPRRKVNLRKDIPMMVPRRVDLTKR
ncbi:RDD family protein [Kineococcus radiotolerans]|uniref:RDD domain containing protein n=1 Tax=Kineococcus radiotolerans (strain ATCC BAA-149 / DSM 14245 / SRS30216) TaxID=266940 RepID=A6WA82_KINRD|nr:RDD family protein [Kineococcus radiotolerans]ABS03721.1 RDD domain containing protein [Kineococcus radiotolerans SRS30216 = ATCC BAA-149]